MLKIKAFYCFLVPSMEFKDDTYEVFESEGKVTAIIVRHGDITHESTVRCYTRQASAQVMMDYNERPDTDDSVVSFKPGTCSLTTLTCALYSLLSSVCRALAYSWGGRS